MYKIKKSADGSILIKFNKQKDVNYQSVCDLNALNLEALPDFEFSLKHFKIQMKYNINGCYCFDDILRSNTNIDMITNLLVSIFSAVDTFLAAKLNVQGILMRPDCIFVTQDGGVRLIYVPADQFEQSNTVESLTESIISIINASSDTAQLYRRMTSAYMSEGLSTVSRMFDTLSGEQNNFNEGGTTVLGRRDDAAPRMIIDSHEGETTVLNSNMFTPEAVNVNEAGTTVLSRRDNAAPRMNMDSHEGETTVLSAAMLDNQTSYADDEQATVMLGSDMTDADNEGATVFLDDVYGENTIIDMNDDEPVFEGEFSQQQNENNEIPQNGFDENDDSYNENATCLIEDDEFNDADDSVSAENGMTESEPSAPSVPDMPEAAEEDYSEQETVMPGINDPLSKDRTLLGANDLAQKMAYSSIPSNNNLPEIDEKVVPVNENVNKTAYFVRFMNSQIIYVTKNYFTMGSGSNMDCIISGNALISRYHATVVIKDSRFFIVDNNSTNKLYVDGKQAVPFEDNEIFTGSRIVLANEIFDFHIK